MTLTMPGKVALLKELGRAAFENPLDPGGSTVVQYFNNQHKYRAENAAIAELKSKNNDVCEVKTCPVCGVESLLIHDDIEIEDIDPHTGQGSGAVRFTYQANCVCCSFEIQTPIKNGKEYGLPLEEYWQEEKL